MQKIESKLIKEEAYIEKLENGLTTIIIPRKTTNKKYVIWGTHFGSIDNHFIMPKTKEEVYVPDGVAHFLEHKMFEQKSGKNSLDTLMALGVDANAYTTNDHTAYLFEATSNFYEALDELMDYVQNPYFTDENVEKEKGIIGQEIGMYDDEPSWQLYMNAMDCLYENNAVKIDIAGTVKSIAEITPDVLYKCYNTFYNPSNMVLVVCGNFEVEEILQEIKNRLIKKESQEKIERIYPKDKLEINKKYIEEQMQVSQPIFMIALKDTLNHEDIVKRHIAIEVLLNMLAGKSSKLYQELYQQGILLTPLSVDYEFSESYAHALIQGQSAKPEKVEKKLEEEIERIKGILSKDSEEVQKIKENYERLKKKVYGDYVAEYNSIADVSRMFLQDYIKGINTYDYIEKFNDVTFEYAMQIFDQLFEKDNRIMSVIRPKE